MAGSHSALSTGNSAHRCKDFWVCKDCRVRSLNFRERFSYCCSPYCCFFLENLPPCWAGASAWGNNCVLKLLFLSLPFICVLSDLHLNPSLRCWYQPAWNRSRSALLSTRQTILQNKLLPRSKEHLEQPAVEISTQKIWGFGAGDAPTSQAKHFWV